MLQQTQVARVAITFPMFLELFPDFERLAASETRELLQAWQGMGYNRRALNLRAAAQKICEHHGGKLPKDPVQLRLLPGIGNYTAHSIPVFAFNEPQPVIETNIRSVMIHFFCKGREQVAESEISSLVLTTVDHKQPRNWFNALMDLGSEIKRNDPSINKRVAAYKQQSKFNGSKRQVRGQVLTLLTKQHTASRAVLLKLINSEKYSVIDVANDLVAEGFLSYERGVFRVR
jgi:A/G-specific adenine glycosylase